MAWALLACAEAGLAARRRRDGARRGKPRAWSRAADRRGARGGRCVDRLAVPARSGPAPTRSRPGRTACRWPDRQARRRGVGRARCRYHAALALGDSDDEADLREAVGRLWRSSVPPAARTCGAMREGLRAIQAGARARTRADPKGLTPREREILELLRDDLTNEQGSPNGSSCPPRTVDHHVSAVLAKLGVALPARAVAAARVDVGNARQTWMRGSPMSPASAERLGFPASIRRGETDMSLYMDVHNLGDGVTVAAVAQAHRRPADAGRARRALPAVFGQQSEGKVSLPRRGARRAGRVHGAPRSPRSRRREVTRCKRGRDRPARGVCRRRCCCGERQRSRLVAWRPRQVRPLRGGRARPARSAAARNATRAFPQHCSAGENAGYRYFTDGEVQPSAIGGMGAMSVAAGGRGTLISDPARARAPARSACLPHRQENGRLR